jgi:hypothetical protein
MKAFATPRFDAAGLTSLFRARNLEALQRRADHTATLHARLDPSAELRERVHRADRIAPANPSLWILHAR